MTRTNSTGLAGVAVLAAWVVAAGCGGGAPVQPPFVPSEVFKAKTDGTAEERLAHIEALAKLLNEGSAQDPTTVREASVAHADAVEKTAFSILELPELTKAERVRAVDSLLSTLSQRVDAEPTTESLERVIGAADRILARYPKSDVATLASFAKSNLLATVPEKLLPDRTKRMDRLTAAALELGEQEPPHPNVVDIVSEMAPGAERLRSYDRAKAMYRLLSEKYKADPRTRFAAGSLRRLEQIGKTIDDIKGVDLDGKPVDLADLRGKVVLVEFWSLTSEPWMKSLPELVKLRERLGPEGFEILGVNIDYDLTAVKRFLTERGVAWPQISSPPPLDPNAATMENDLQLRYGVGFLPLELVVDRDGTLVMTGYGVDQMVSEIEKLLGVSPEGSKGAASSEAGAEKAPVP